MSLRLIRILFKQLNGVEHFMPESREILLGHYLRLPGRCQKALSAIRIMSFFLVCDGQRTGSIKFNILNAGLR
jgi:hypothetical protein